MIVVYSSDENYAQHMCVSMLSLMENNQSVSNIQFYVFDNGILDASKAKIEGVCSKYGREIIFLDFVQRAEELSQRINCPISISTYARLFIPEMLPENCRRVIYLDCDTVVCGDLTALWETELSPSSVGGVKDTLSSSARSNTGLSADAVYINAGVLLIDVERWRKDGRQQEFLEYIAQREGKVFYQDQGVLNAVLSGDVKVLPPRYNAMTPMLTSSYKRFVALYRLEDYYSEYDILEAKSSPAILHFTPEYVGRVWEEKCLHPKRSYYEKYLNMSPWKGSIQPKTLFPAKLKLLYWMERNLPVPVLRLLKVA